MRSLGSFAGVAALVAAGAASASAQEPEQELPEPTIQPLALEFSDAGLSGPGAAAIRAELPDAQFIGIGEDHGYADAPSLVAALALEAAPYGDYRYVVETGPWTANWVRDKLVSGGVEGFGQSLQGRPLAIPFLLLREEAEVAMRFLEEGQIWGVDQEFIGSPLIHLEWLANRSDDDEGTVRSLFETEKAAFAAGDQSAVLMSVADAATWATLRSIYQDDAEALELIDALEISQGIYAANFTGRGYDNNADRVALIHEYFLDRYARANVGDVPPRVIFKMGAVHVGRATSPMKTFDIGSTVEGMAAANGLEALHIAYIPVGGETLSLRPSPEGSFSVAPVSFGATLIEKLRAHGVDMDVVTNGDGHYVIDLEPVRRAMGNRGLNEADWMFRFVVLGFDYLVTTNQAKPGTPLAQK